MPHGPMVQCKVKDYNGTGSLWFGDCRLSNAMVADVEENEMDSTSLGILMSSCIFNETLSDVCPQRFEATSAVPRECTRTMIECYEEIFVL